MHQYLVATNNSATLREVRAALAGEQNDVIVTGDGFEAVDHALDNHANAILLGVHLPGLKGPDVARALRAFAPTEHVPIIFLAENKEEAKEASDAHLSLVDCLVAPYDRAALKARVEAAVRTGENVAALRTRGTNVLLAVLDPLTRLYHRRYLLHVLGYEAARSVRYKSPLAVLLVDVDNLAEINQQYGILSGDNVLVEVGHLVRHTARAADIVGRADVQDFLVLAPQTNRAGARVLADRICKMIAEHHFIAEKLDLHVTVSVGVACADGADLSQNLALMARAEGALDRAKHAGKNRVEME